MIVGEGPGAEEDLEGIPFVGKSGLLLDTALFYAGIPRDNFYITNVVKERLTKANGEDRPPTDTELDMALPELRQEMFDVQPEVVFAVGGTALRAVLLAANDDPNRVWLSAHHGLAIPLDHFLLVPCFHPAAGLHRPEYNPHFTYDINRAVDYLRSVDIGYGFDPPMATKNLYGKQTSLPVVLGGRVALDSEWTSKGTFCYSISGVRGEGWVVPPNGLQFHLGTKVIFHYFLADIPNLERDGYPIWDLDWDDTMAKAYNLQIEPQALKDLVARYLGRNRPEYPDLIRPHHERKLWIIAEDEARQHDLAKETIKPLKKVKDPSPVILDTLKLAGEVVEAKKWAYAAIRDRKSGKRKVDLEGRFKSNGIQIPNTDLYDVPEDEWVPYACDDAADTLLISDILDQKLEEMGLTEVYEMDQAILPMLYLMQKTGLPVDVGMVLELKDEFDREIASNSAVMSSVSAEVGGPPDFNPRSVPDVIDALRRLGRNTKRRGGGDSSDDRILSLVLAEIETRQKHGDRFVTRRDALSKQFVESLQVVRELSVYSGTHCSGILEFLRPDGQWLDYKWKYTRTVSGRLATEDFNVLNVPTRTENGKKVRKCFVAPDGWVFGSADLSQIELRMAAHLSQDKAMMAAFLADEDLHARTASLLFGVPLGLVTAVQRYAAKTLNFAILYGISAQELYNQLRLAGITEFDLQACQGLILEWFKVYSGVRSFFDGVVTQTRQDGFVRDMWGRIRYLPNIYLPATDWRGRHLRAEAERHAQNHVIQAGAQGVIKRAMAKLWRLVILPMLRSQGDQFLKPILQIHDELLFLVREGCEEIAHGIVKGCMVWDQPIFSIPIKSDWAVGKSWGDV